MKVRQLMEMRGVRQYEGEDEPVELVLLESGNLEPPRWCVAVYLDGRYISTYVDVCDLVAWLRENRPDLLDSDQGLHK